MGTYRYFEFTLAGSLSRSSSVPHLYDWLLEHGIEFAQIVHTQFKSHWALSLYAPSRALFEKLTRRFPRRTFPGIQPKLKVLEKEDWFDKWKKRYRPFTIGKTFRLLPAWQKKTSRPRGDQRRVLLIDPGAAFGSGIHETTQLMLQMMESLQGRMNSFLDLGTGTGILCIGARHLGAHTVVGVDLDRPSIQSARKNFRLNRTKGKLCCAPLEDFQSSNRFDVVAANLISLHLVAQQKRIARWVKPGGFLIVSGILKRNWKSFLRDFHPQTIRRVKTVRGKSWAGAIYQRTKKA